MRAYRLETKQGLGPFVSDTLVPNCWGDSHMPPMDSNSPYYKLFVDWCSIHFPENIDTLPFQVKFAFDSLKRLEECFVGYRNIPPLKLYVLELNPKEDNFLVIPDGQVLYESYTNKQLYRG